MQSSWQGKNNFYAFPVSPVYCLKHQYLFIRYIILTDNTWILHHLSTAAWSPLFCVWVNLLSHKIAFSPRSHNQSSGLTYQRLRFAVNFEPLNLWTFWTRERLHRSRHNRPTNWFYMRNNRRWFLSCFCMKFLPFFTKDFRFFAFDR